MNTQDEKKNTCLLVELSNHGWIFIISNLVGTNERKASCRKTPHQIENIFRNVTQSFGIDAPVFDATDLEPHRAQVQQPPRRESSDTLAQRGTWCRSSSALIFPCAPSHHEMVCESGCRWRGASEFGQQNQEDPTTVGGSQMESYAT